MVDDATKHSPMNGWTCASISKKFSEVHMRREYDNSNSMDPYTNEPYNYQRLGLPKPSGLIISSVPPPDYPDQHDQLSTLNEDDFVKQAYALGWFPKEGIENVELKYKVSNQ